jgi:hypothetical protein
VIGARVGSPAVESKTSSEPSDVKASAGGSKLFASLFSFAILTGVAFLVIGLAPTDLPPDKGSNFVDTVFHNKGVVLAARLLLVSAVVVLAIGGVFIVTSIAMRMRNREWLKRAGPFEIGGPEWRDVESEVEHWRAIAVASQEEVAELKEGFQISRALIEKLRRELADYEGVQTG